MLRRKAGDADCVSPVAIHRLNRATMPSRRRAPIHQTNVLKDGHGMFDVKFGGVTSG